MTKKRVKEMTLARAVEILNREQHWGSRDWAAPEPDAAINLVRSRQKGQRISEQQAIQAAKKYDLEAQP